MNGKYFTPADRRAIAEEWAGYASPIEIAAKFGVVETTIRRELQRGNATGELDDNGRLAYDPNLAQVNFCAALRRRGRKAKDGQGATNS